MGPYQIANFISSYCSKDRKQVSLHATQTGQIDRWEGSGLASGAGVHEESPGNRERIQMYEPTEHVFSVLEVKIMPLKLSAQSWVHDVN